MAIAQIGEITGDTARVVEAWKTYVHILNEDWNTTEGVYIERANKKIQGKIQGQKETVLNLYNMGMKEDFIAKAVNVSIDLVRQWLGLTKA